MLDAKRLVPVPRHAELLVARHVHSREEALVSIAAHKVPRVRPVAARLGHLPLCARRRVESQLGRARFVEPGL